MAFRTKRKSSLSIESPESLFSDIKTKKIPGLLTQQGDLLRDYHANHQNSPDLAIQLPTGSGKTLVALLIGEWRRLAKNERVVFACPTKQLVHQVVDQANSKYGLKVIPFTGSKRDYDPADKSTYESGDAVAITTYSSLFNSNPFFEDPHTIIFDDAHAADGYVASNWTLEIKQYLEDEKVLFDAIASVLKPILSEIDFRRFASSPDSSGDVSWYEMIPNTLLLPYLDELDGVIGLNVSKPSHVFPWQFLSGDLDKCNLYLGSQSIYIRPYLAPTFSHKPFSKAKQRIYLSATPGEGGELERIFCRRSIDRMSPPKGWDRHTIGRRFFVFPDLSLDSDESKSLLIDIVKRGRALILTGDKKTADAYEEYFGENSGFPVFSAYDIEKSKDPFLSHSQAVAILANRYDGIDFPEEECRNIILLDIPTATNLQEKFLISRLAASRVHDVRILTRIVQAFGRCTRGGTDYSTVVVIGDKMVSYLSKMDRLQYFHPELQGEIKFGLEQSRDSDYSNILENLDHFYSQDEDWIDAQSEIYEYRDESKRELLLGSDCLSNSVENEVAYIEAFWAGDFVEALEQCKEVLGSLLDDSLRGERALWNYFAGCAANRIENQSTLSTDYFRAAAKGASSLSWLHALVHTNSSENDDESSDASSEDLLQIDRLEDLFLRLGISNNRKYDKFEAEIRNQLNDPIKFEAGHLSLGILLGFDAGKIESEGSPDPWWMLGENSILVFEDHANANATSSISVSKARQAASHEKWIRSEVSSDPDECNIDSFLITPVSDISSAAVCQLSEVCVIDLTEFIDWSESVMQTIRDIRRTFPDKGDLIWRNEAYQKLKTNGMIASQISKTLKAKRKNLEPI
ncbi:MAG: DEAD/DEAH box helicase [Puniceicoccaceae bacterium]